MSRLRRGLIVLGVLGCGVLWRGVSPAQASRGFERQLRDAVEAGELAAERADLYRLYRLRAPHNLPPGLRSAARSVAGPERAARSGPARVGTAGTSALRVLRARLAHSSPEVQRAAAPYLNPPAARTTAPRASRAVGKDVDRTLANRITTANFSMEWGPDLTNEDGTTPPRDDAPAFVGDPAVGGNQVPDVVERWAAYLEVSYGRTVDELGLGADEPLLGQTLVPVYLGNSDPATVSDDIASGNLFGFVDRVGDDVPHLVVNNDFNRLLGLTNIAEIQRFLKVTAAHEFFHVIHFLYEAELTRNSLAALDADIWWWEASATWLEDAVFDEVDDYHVWYDGDGGWTEFVENGLAPNFNDLDYDVRAYGGAIFAKYLEEHVGGEASVGEVWERIRPSALNPQGQRVLDAFDDYAMTAGFDSLEHLFLGFAGANAVMDYEEGAAYGEVPVRKESLHADSVLDPGLELPRYLGATYQSDVLSASGGLEVALDGSPAGEWGLALTLLDDAGFPVVLGASDLAGAPLVEVGVVAGFSSAYATPTFLDRSRSPTAYSTSTQPDGNGDAVPPSVVSVTAGWPRAVPGGFDLRWGAAADPGSGVAGYVARWRRAGAVSWSARTLFGPLGGVEVRGVNAGSVPREYEIQVFAYDARGNRDPAGAVSQGLEIPPSPGDTEVLPVEVDECVATEPSPSGAASVCSEPAVTYVLDAAAHFHSVAIGSHPQWSQVTGDLLACVGVATSTLECTIPADSAGQEYGFEFTDEEWCGTPVTYAFTIRVATDCSPAPPGGGGGGSGGCFLDAASRR